MVLSVRHKLALALSLLSLAVCTGIYLGLRDDFNRDFNFYLNQVRINDAHRLAEFVETEFKPNSINDFAVSRHDWSNIERTAMANNQAIMPPEAGPHHPPGAPHPRHNSEFDGPPPPGSPFTLVDLNNRSFFDKLAIDATWPKIEINGTDGIIGYIAIRPFIERNTKASDLYNKQQQDYFLTVVIAALLVSVAAAWPIVFILLRPLSQLSETVNSIANRDYCVKSDIKSKDELGELSKNINLLANKLASHDRFQSEWLSQISHDLRTPASIMLAEIEAIKDGVYPLTKEAIESLETETKRLDNQINDLHELSVLKCGEVPLHRQETDIADMVRSVAKDTQTLRQSCNLDFSLYVEDKKVNTEKKVAPLKWSLDREKMYRVIVNLMQNSIRYSHSGGFINCKMKIGETLKLIWEDSAPGVIEEDLGKIFEPMYQCNKNKNFNNGSSGIGLSIVAAIVKLHGGDVNAQNIPNKGLRFTVNLP